MSSASVRRWMLLPRRRLGSARSTGLRPSLMCCPGSAPVDRRGTPPTCAARSSSSSPGVVRTQAPVRHEFAEHLTALAVAACTPLLARDDVPEHVRSLTSATVLGVERNVAHLVAESVEDARQQWIDVFGRDRADLGPARAAPRPTPSRSRGIGF
jgi:hypothetical protein